MALPMCPWALVSGATVYISVMSGYATFLGPMTGLMVFDYVLIRKQKMKLSSLVRPNSIFGMKNSMTGRANLWAVTVRLLAKLNLLLLARCELASPHRMGMRRRSSLPRLLINGINRVRLTRSHSRILPLLAA